MKPIIHSFPQGSEAWHAHRRAHLNASEASAMLGISAYQTRSDLLKEKLIGAEDISAEVQTLFDNGHRFEAQAREWAAEIIGADLYPVVASMEVDGLPLSASYDGAPVEADVIWEHKTLNKKIAASLDQWAIPDQYKPQMEQQLLILGAKRCLFMASNGERESMRHAWYESDPALRAKLLAGWKQFAEDLKAYQYAEVIPAAVAAPTMALPAVSIKVEGAVALISNLDIFGAGLKAFIARLPEKPSTDQEFADCKAACKTLQEAQDALDAAEAHALGQIASFDAMQRTKALWFDLARSTRLAVEKLVVAREQQIKVEIRQMANDAFALHVANLNKRIGKPYLSLPIPDFASSMKNKRTVASLHDAVDTMLANSKIAANEIADRIQINLSTLRELATEHSFLFHDTAHLVLKDNDDLTALVKMRIAEHKATQEKRIEEERERIRREELAKIEAEQKKEAARIEAERVANEKKSAPQPSASTDSLLPSGRQAAAADPSQPVPAAPTGVQQPKPAVTLVKGIIRPPDETIIAVLANHYRVPEATVISWIKEMAIFQKAVA